MPDDIEVGLDQHQPMVLVKVSVFQSFFAMVFPYSAEFFRQVGL